MRNKFAKFILIFAILLLLTATFTACDIFLGKYEITIADISANDSLYDEDADGVLEARLNETFKLTIDWHNENVKGPKISWFIVENDVAMEIENAQNKTLTYVFNERTESIFTFYAIVNEVKTNEICVRVVDAPLKAPTITSPTHKIVRGQIQQIISQKSDIQLVASWNAEDIDQNLQVEIEWRVNGASQDCNTQEFCFCVANIQNECNVEISAELVTDEEHSVTSQILLVFVDEHEMVDDLTIAVDDALWVADETYYVFNNRIASAKVRLGVDVYPHTSNLYSPCVWSVQDSTGERTLQDEERDINLSLSYGKNVVKATVENMESRQVIIYAMPYEFLKLPQEIKTNILRKFEWCGNSHDYYINNTHDLDAVIAFAVSSHKTDKVFDMYVANESWHRDSAFLSACQNSLENLNSESGYFEYSTTILNSIGTIKFGKNTVFAMPEYTKESDFSVTQANAFVRYEEQSATREKLPIDDVERTMLVSNSNQLYLAVSNGYQPLFDGTENGRELLAMYEKARQVLLTYVADDMTDTQKVGVIFDWIVNEIDYDYAVVQDDSETTFMCNAFYLEGVFNDARAVCDGKSKAFALLCGMENIKSVRVVGRAGTDILQQDKWVNHAWNKVLVDANGDGVREWYVVDTTWGDVAFSNGDNQVTEYINYRYFLVSDDDISSTHISSSVQPKANTSYNVFENTSVKIDGIDVDFYVEDILQRTLLLKYSEENGNMCLCVYLAPNAQTAIYGWGFVSLGNNVYIIYSK